MDGVMNVFVTVEKGVDVEDDIDDVSIDKKD